MKITFEINDTLFAKAERYTFDPVNHCKTMIDHWAQRAEQENPGVDVLTLPTLAEKEQQRKDEIAAEELKQTQRKQAIDELVLKVPDSQKESVKQRLSKPDFDLVHADLIVTEALRLEEELLLKKKQDKEQQELDEKAKESRTVDYLLKLISTNPALVEALSKSQLKTEEHK